MVLSDRIILVTGSSRGIGAALARGLARHGATIIVNYHRSKDMALAVLDEVKKYSPESSLLGFDVGDKEAVDRAFEQIISGYGRIDVLFNNAGIMKSSQIEGISDSDTFDIFRTNAIGSLHCLQAAILSMKKMRSGKIINISSISQFSPFYRSTQYAMSKGAVNMLTRCAALELGEYNITVNSLIPGIIESDIDPRYDDPALMERMRKIVPLQSIGKPETMVGSAVFLASDLSNYITGIDILVDGGFSLFKDKNPQ